MSLSHEHIGPKISAKIKIYILIRAELLFPLCYEIPCIGMNKGLNLTLGIFPKFSPWHLDGALISATCRKMCVVTLQYIDIQYKTSFSMRRVHILYIDIRTLGWTWSEQITTKF